MPQPDALEAFIAAVESGMHDDAIARFYTDDASMQDNLGPLRKGKDTLIARNASGPLSLRATALSSGGILNSFGRTVQSGPWTSWPINDGKKTRSPRSVSISIRHR